MEPGFWLDRWRKNEIGFHASSVQAALSKHWRKLNVPQGGLVLVPLAGKSLDMIWLASQGHRVAGFELSPVAVKNFFAENELTPAVRTVDNFEVHSANGVELWCGDFFSLDAGLLPPIDAAYDRAALVALPPSMQPRYALKQAELLPAGAPILLIGLDYDPQEMQGPPFAISRSRIGELYEGHFEISVLDVKDGLAKSDHLAKRGVTRLEEASYLLRRKA